MGSKPSTIKMFHPIDNPLPNLISSHQASDRQFFKSIAVGTVRYGSYRGESHIRDDSCVVYSKESREYIGRILAIFRENDGQVFCWMEPVKITSTISFTVSKKVYECPNVFKGRFDLQNAFIIGWRCLKDKLAYVRISNDCFTFFRFPNLVESS